MEDIELDQVTKVIGYHPRFLDHFLRTQNFIMNGDGPLPYDFRYYLAIIAAARHQCPYLVKIYKEKFIKSGCAPEWLNGLNHIPAKLYAIYEVNKLLAHRPWLLRKEHIQSLTKGKNSWSLSEVVHAIVLLSHFHSLSSFVFSCGLTQKLDGLSNCKLKSPPLQDKQQFHNVMYDQSQESEILNLDRKHQEQQNQLRSRTQHTNITSLGANGNNNATEKSALCCGVKYCDKHMEHMIEHDQSTVSVETLMERMKILSQRQDECTEAELSFRFKNVEMQTAELSTASSEVVVEVPPIISHYIEDPSFTYEDFARRGAENVPNTFRIQDYSWDDHGYSLVNALYNDVGTLLDKTFRAAYNLTYFTMGGIKNVDTSKFRRAIWNYIQCIYGIRHDDYDYGEVNQLLDRSLKMFIKTACCFPERITKHDYDSILSELQDSEKVHVNLMIMAARNQAELLYALREIMRYMT